MRALLVAILVVTACGGAATREDPAWWCAEHFDITGRSGGRCARSEAECYEDRDALVRDGASMTDCEAKELAFCMQNGGATICGTDTWCKVTRDEAIRAGSSPGPCRETR